MTREQQAGPDEEAASFLGCFGWKQSVLPFAFKAAQAVSNGHFESIKEIPGIHDRVFKESWQGQLHGEFDFQVVGRMQRVFVVLDVAGGKHVVISPDEKAEDAGEQDVERPRFEDCVVDQLVGAVKEKDVEGAVREQDQEQGKQRHAGGCEPGGKACQQDEGQMADDLQRAKPVAALIERGQFGAGQGHAVPVNLYGTSIALGRCVGRHQFSPLAAQGGAHSSTMSVLRSGVENIMVMMATSSPSFLALCTTLGGIAMVSPGPMGK